MRLRASGGVHGARIDAGLAGGRLRVDRIATSTESSSTPRSSTRPYGTEVLTRFLREIAGCEQQWSPQSVIAEQVATIRAQVGEGG